MARSVVPERSILDQIQNGDLEVGPLQVEVVGREVRLNGQRQGDLVVELSWEDQQQRFLAECKSESTPKKIRTAMMQAQELAKLGPSLRPMVIVPYLSDEAIEVLLEKAVSGVDLSGNYVIVVPGTWLLLRSDQPNQFPASRPIKKIYQGVSSLVSRVLFSVPSFDLVKDVRSEIEQRGGSISLPTVSKVLSSLEDELIIRRKPTIKLLQPDRLLDRLARGYTRPEPTATMEGKSQLGPAFFEGLLQNADRSGGRVIGRDEARYTVAGASDQRLTVYSTQIGSLTDGLDFEETSRFANVEFVEVRDETVFFDPRKEAQFPWCSPLQIFLEFANGGKREREIAEPIRERLVTGVEERLSEVD